MGKERELNEKDNQEDFGFHSTIKLNLIWLTRGETVVAICSLRLSLCFHAWLIQALNETRKNHRDFGGFNIILYCETSYAHL